MWKTGGAISTKLWPNMTGWWLSPTPLKNMSSSIGMMTFPIYGKIKNVPTEHDLSGLETRKDSSQAKELFLKEKKLKSQWITKLRYRHPQLCSQSVPCHSHGYTGRPARRTKNYMFAAWNYVVQFSFSENGLLHVLANCTGSSFSLFINWVLLHFWTTSRLSYRRVAGTLPEWSTETQETQATVFQNQGIWYLWMFIMRRVKLC